MNEMWFSARELANLSIPDFPNTKRGIQKKSIKENWFYRKRNASGGGREYPLSALPLEVRAFIAGTMIPDEEADDKSENKKEEIYPFKQAFEPEIKQEEAAESPLPEKIQDKAEARAQIVRLCNDYIKDNKLPKRKGREMFCSAFLSGKIDVDDWVLTEIKSCSANSILNWQRKLEAKGIVGLNSNHGRHRKGCSIIESHEPVKNTVLGMLAKYPHSSAKHVMRVLRARFTDDMIPSYRTVQRWLANWKYEHTQEFCSLAAPDKWRSNYQAADGSYSESVHGVNELWEYDSTPADLQLKDGTRCILVGVIDVFSRRLILHCSRSSSSRAVAGLTRKALMQWGVPKAVKTDNGSDYVSRHMKRIFTSLNIEHRVCKPFSPEQKPHIERAFRTFSHDLLELQPGFVGHNVAERKDIEDRRSFAARLMKTGKDPLELNVTVDELQQFCDDWCNHVYAHDVHSSLSGKTPFQVAAANSVGLRIINDERALDVLLSEAPGGDGFRVVGKKGISVSGAYFTAGDLGGHEGERVQVFLDDTDIGQIFVYDEDGIFICKAINPERKGVSREEIAAARKAKQKAENAQFRKSMRRAENAADIENIVDEIVRGKKLESSKLVSFPADKKDYETEALQEAGKAARADETPESKPLTEKEKQDFIEAQKQAEKQKIIEIEDTETFRFRKAIKVEEALENGESITDADAQWLHHYKMTAEYQARKEMYLYFGKKMFAS